MSSSNYRRNAAAIDQFRKELRAMMEDISQIDKEVLNQAMNDGVAFAKRRTRPGLHPNPVTFTTKYPKEKEVNFVTRDGKEVHFTVKIKAGKAVSFEVKNPVTGGFLRESWHKTRTKKNTKGVEAELVNTAEYASYWNDGHRIVNSKNGPTKGFVKGTHVLEKTQNYISKRMIVLFERKVKAVQKKHDK